MKINKESWHYKMVLFFSGEGRMPKSLCTYFWTALLAPFIFAIAMSIALFLAGCTVYQIFWGLPEGMVILAVLGWAIWSVMIAITVKFAVEYFEFTHDKRIDKEIEFPPLVNEYARAIKDKICPLIEYVK